MKSFAKDHVANLAAEADLEEGDVTQCPRSSLAACTDSRTTGDCRSKDFTLLFLL